MNMTIKILGALSILAGIVIVLAGVAEAGDKNVGGLSIVIGSGLFMALGVTAFVLNRDN